MAICIPEETLKVKSFPFLAIKNKIRMDCRLFLAKWVTREEFICMD